MPYYHVLNNVFNTILSIVHSMPLQFVHTIAVLTASLCNCCISQIYYCCFKWPSVTFTTLFQVTVFVTTVLNAYQQHLLLLFPVTATVVSSKFTSTVSNGHQPHLPLLFQVTATVVSATFTLTVSSDCNCCISHIYPYCFK